MMTANGTADDLAEVRQLVETALEGAKANERPDLIQRLTKTTGLLASGPATTEVVGFAARNALDALASLEIDLTARQAMLSDPGRGPRLVAEMRYHEGRLNRFRESSAEWPQILGEGLSAAGSDLDFDLGSRVRAVLDEGIITIESGRTKGSSFEDWMRLRLRKEAETSYDQLRSAVEITASRLSTLLEIPVPAPVVEHLAVPSPTLVAQLNGPRAGQSARAPVSGQLLGVVMPTYGGGMMTLVVSRFAGLALPGWLIAGGAAGGAVMMGGAAIVSERQRQRARRNGETLAGLRAATETFRLALTKQLRDGIRTAQQELRQFVGNAVTEQGRKLLAEADNSRAAAEETNRTSNLLKDIADDLTSVRELQHQALRLVQHDPKASQRIWSISSHDRTTAAATARMASVVAG